MPLSKSWAEHPKHVVDVLKYLDYIWDQSEQGKAEFEAGMNRRWV